MFQILGREWEMDGLRRWWGEFCALIGVPGGAHRGGGTGGKKLTDRTDFLVAWCGFCKHGQCDEPCTRESYPVMPKRGQPAPDCFREAPLPF
ncbi:hypothetical protein L6258_02455 [Candidatus Parcubacteria bacterium]|nr:hypothetical protein [Candidatus Parcubacteria bacterium]